MDSRSLHFPVSSDCLQFFVVPRGEYDPPLLELRLLDAEGVGDRKPAELGVRDLEGGFGNVLPAVCVVLLASPRCGDRPLSEDLACRGEYLLSDAWPLLGALPVRDPRLLTDPPLESRERYVFPPDDLDLVTSLRTFQPRI